MTSEQIKQTKKRAYDLAAQGDEGANERIPLWEIAYQLAKIVEKLPDSLADLSAGKRDAVSEGRTIGVVSPADFKEYVRQYFPHAYKTTVHNLMAWGSDRGWDDSVASTERAEQPPPPQPSKPSAESGSEGRMGLEYQILDIQDGLKRIDSIARVAKARRIFQDFPAALDRIQEVVQRIRALMERAEQTPPPQPSEASTASRCEHSRLDEDGICRACGLDCRGIG